MLSRVAILSYLGGNSCDTEGVLGGLVDVERDLIRTRTAEGRSRAKERGQHMGRPPKLNPAQQAEARRRRAEGATLTELAKSYNVGVATISVIAHPSPASASPGRLADITNRTVSSTEARLAFAVLTTERKAA